MTVLSHARGFVLPASRLISSPLDSAPITGSVPANTRVNIPLVLPSGVELTDGDVAQVSAMLRLDYGATLPNAQTALYGWALTDAEDLGGNGTPGCLTRANSGAVTDRYRGVVTGGLWEYRFGAWQPLSPAFTTVRNWPGGGSPADQGHEGSESSSAGTMSAGFAFFEEYLTTTLPRFQFFPGNHGVTPTGADYTVKLRGGIFRR